MRIGTRLYMGFGILLLLIICMAALVAYDVAGVQRSLDLLGQRDLPSLSSYVQISRLFSTEVSQTHAYLTTQDGWRLTGVHSARLLIDTELDHLTHSAQGETRAQLLVISDRMRLFRIQSDLCIRWADEKNYRRALTGWMNDVTPMTESIGERLDRLRDTRTDQTLFSTASALQHVSRLTVISQAVVVAALITAMVSFILITQSLLVPIRKFVKAVDTIAAGDMSARVEWPVGDELGELAADFNRMADQVSGTIEELHRTRVMLEERNGALEDSYCAVQEEMELAARIQQEILPRRADYLDVVTAADMVAASDIGGDFYDVLPGRPKSGQISFVVGDVSGKGIAAALLMVFLVTVIRQICHGDRTPDEMLQELNRLMMARFDDSNGMYATCFIGVLDRSTLRLSYSKAGHEEPLWYRSSERRCEWLPCAGLFVGLFSDGRYETEMIQLGEGDRLIFFTDGIVEARSPDGEWFSRDRLRVLVEAQGASSAGEIIAHIKNELDVWTGGGLLRDDMTLMVVEIPNAAGPHHASDGVSSALNPSRAYLEESTAASAPTLPIGPRL